MTREEEVETLHQKLDALTEEANELRTLVKETEIERDKLDDLRIELEEVRDELQTKVEDLEDELEETTSKLEAERDFNEAARTLVSALETYLSWLDNPPPNMGEPAQREFLVNFRRDLDYALREMR